MMQSCSMQRGENKRKRQRGDDVSRLGSNEACNMITCLPSHRKTNKAQSSHLTLLHHTPFLTYTSSTSLCFPHHALIEFLHHPPFPEVFFLITPHNPPYTGCAVQQAKVITWDDEVNDTSPLPSHHPTQTPLPVDTFSRASHIAFSQFPPALVL